MIVVCIHLEVAFWGRSDPLYQWLQLCNAEVSGRDVFVVIIKRWLIQISSMAD